MDVGRAELAEFGADDSLGEFGFVAVAAEVRENQVAEPVADDFGGDGGGGFIVEVPVPAHDALSGGPGTNGVVLEHSDVVIGFEDQEVHLPDAFDDELGGMAEVGNDADGVGAVMECEGDRVEGVVGDAEGFDGQVTNRESLAVGKDAPRDADAVGPVGLFVDGFGGKAVRVDGDGMFFTDGTEAANVIGVFVGDEDGVEVVELPADGGEALGDLTAAEAGINENGGVGGLDEGAVAGAAAA